MKRNRFMEEQSIVILKVHEAGVLRWLIFAVSRCQRPSIYKWKAKFGGMDVSEAKRLRTLEDENTKLKRLLADAMLNNTALKDLLGMVTPAGKRKAVVHLREAFGMRKRRACMGPIPGIEHSNFAIGFTRWI